MEFWRFIGPGTDLGEPMRGSYDPFLVVLSVCVASLAAFSALAVVQRILASRNTGIRVLWLIAGAVAMGSGIWAMHFTGMLAFSMHASVSYSLWITLVSMVPAMIGSACALHTIGRDSVNWRRLQLGGLLLAGGIGAMHYTGMEAMRMDALMRYRPSLFVLSIVVAHVLATIALYVRFLLKSQRLGIRLTSAVVMGSAVAGMHYTAMAAVLFFPASGARQLTMSLPPLWMGLLICFVVSMIIGLTIVGTVVDRRLALASDCVLEGAIRHRAVLDTMVDGVITFDPNGTIETLNPAASRILGHEAESMIGMNVKLLVPDFDFGGLHEELSSRETLAHRQVVEIGGQHKSGEIISLELAVSEMQIGRRRLFSATLRDIGQRKEVEAQLRQTHKLETIGQLAAGIAHEINTPTQYVGDNTRFLKDAFADLNRPLIALSDAVKNGSPSAEVIAQLKADLERADAEYLAEEIPKAIEQSLEGIERVAKIVRAMKDFSHPAENKVALDINRAIDSTVTVARAEWKYVAKMETDFDPDLPAVPCLPGEFNQVVLNMIINAAHAIADVVGDGSESKGKIQVSTRQSEEWAEVRICDNGTGIREEIRERIFDPFFTTKDVGKGTGQGLNIAHNVVVNKHGGQIRVESEVGQGTCFVILLPTTDPSATPVQPAS